jgi:DNA (cytosine-5)-methyltransferase 1
MSLTYGSLFSGYAGLDGGVQSVLGGSTSWFSEIDAAPSKILAHHWPTVPNLGDVTKVDWASVPKVDVITGGSPCQDLSHAGKRAGMKAGTRSNLWVEMREAIAVIRPRLVVWENVRGAGTAEADSALEQCPRCVGDPRDRGPVLRALGRVLGDLTDLGYDAWWYGLPASAVGAAHGRFRYFVFATPADTDRSGWGEHRRGVSVRQEQPAAERTGDAALTLLPTPAVNDMGAGKTVDAWDAWTDAMQAKHGNGNGHGKSLSIEAARLLPSPTVSDGNGAGVHCDGGLDLRTAMAPLGTPRSQHGEDRNNAIWERPLDQPQNLENQLARLLPTPTTAPTTGNGHARNLGAEVQNWGEYATAIRRQEVAFGRPAPLPTEPGKNGQPRLSPRFVEWLMNLPDGWVTDVPGISRNDQLKALGNGVVPAQAAAATRAFLTDLAREAVS